MRKSLDTTSYTYSIEGRFVYKLFILELCLKLLYALISFQESKVRELQ